MSLALDGNRGGKNPKELPSPHLSCAWGTLGALPRGFSDPGFMAFALTGQVGVSPRESTSLWYSGPLHQTLTAFSPQISSHF